jgi:hypothetical protein
MPPSVTGWPKNIPPKKAPENTQNAAEEMTTKFLK